jgi:hypothetical protein
VNVELSVEVDVPLPEGNSRSAVVSDNIADLSHLIAHEYRRLEFKGLPVGATIGLPLGVVLMTFASLLLMTFASRPLPTSVTRAFVFVRFSYRAALTWPVSAALVRGVAYGTSEGAAFALVLIPFVLPLYVVVFFGSPTLPLWGQVAVGLPALPLALLVGTLTPISDARLQKVAQSIGVSLGAGVTGLLVLAGVGFVVLQVLGLLHYVDDIGGMPTLLALAGLLLFASAFVLRLYAFAVKLLRIAIALGVASVVFYYIAKTGLAPGWSWAHTIRSKSTWAWLAVLLAALAVVLRGIQAMVGVRAAHRRYVSEVGTLMVFMSALFICASFGWAIVFNNAEYTVVDKFGGSVTPGAPAQGFLHLGDQRLAEMFVPVLLLTDDEKWRLSNVNHYLKRASLLDARGEPVNHLLTNENDLPRSCPRGTVFPCWILNCPSCIAEKASRRATASTYVHVLRRRGKGAQPRVFALASRFAPELSVILQYWLFYDYDQWKTVSPFGELTQGHSGDWEEVTVGLTDKAPLFIAYSAHCGGHRYAWPDVEAEVASREADGHWVTGRNRPNDPALHPLVGVATGSHANYAHPDSGRAPDWTSCRPSIASGAVLVLSYALNLRDKTNYSAGVIPRVLIAHANEPPMSFPGLWGLRDKTVLRNARTQTLAQESGPDTPAHKQMWRCPIEVLFESEAWHGTGHFNCPSRHVN